MPKKTRFSFSSVDLFERCPFRYAFRYEDELKTIEDYSASNPLLLGTTMHEAIEGDVEKAIENYFMKSPVLTDEHINEAIKISELAPKVVDAIKSRYIGRNVRYIFEEGMFTSEFAGFADLLVKTYAINGIEHYDLYDFKYSNSVEHYLESRQLHVYKMYFEKTHPNCVIDSMAFVFVPKIGTKQTKKESIMQYRNRLTEELQNLEPNIVNVTFDYSKYTEYEDLVKTILSTENYEKKKSVACRYCEIMEYCEKGEDYMILPETTRREVGAPKKRKIWIYGEPFSGKTTMLDKAPNPLNLNTDGNIEFVTMPYIAIKDVVTVEGRITKRKFAWQVLKETIEELEKKQNDFKTIIIDLLEDTREMCRIYKYDELGIEHESDAGYGKGWDMIKTEYLSVIRRFFNLDYDNLIVISHEDKSKDITKKSGQNITRIAPNIQEALANKIAGMVDIVARAVVEEDGSRTLNFKSNEVIFGGGRLKIVGATTIPMDWDALMSVYPNADAVEKDPKKEDVKAETPKAAEEPKAEEKAETPTEEPKRKRRKREE